MAKEVKQVGQTENIRNSQENGRQCRSWAHEWALLLLELSPGTLCVGHRGGHQSSVQSLLLFLLLLMSVAFEPCPWCSSCVSLFVPLAMWRPPLHVCILRPLYVPSFVEPKPGSGVLWPSLCFWLYRHQT